MKTIKMNSCEQKPVDSGKDGSTVTEEKVSTAAAADDDGKQKAPCVPESSDGWIWKCIYCNIRFKTPNGHTSCKKMPNDRSLKPLRKVRLRKCKYCGSKYYENENLQSTLLEAVKKPPRTNEDGDNTTDDARNDANEGNADGKDELGETIEDGDDDAPSTATEESEKLQKDANMAGSTVGNAVDLLAKVLAGLDALSADLRAGLAGLRADEKDKKEDDD